MAWTALSLSLSCRTRATLTLSLVFLSSCSAGLAGASSSNASALAAGRPDPGALQQCLDVDYCPLAARCCQGSVDQQGWIAAAVGWSFWFLTLILICVAKLMTLTPDGPKDLA